MLNPKWYEGMLKHGYEGVRQIETHVTNTMGWSATTGQVERGVPVRGLTEARAAAEIYTAGLARLSSGFSSSGGRVLTLVSRGPDRLPARQAQNWRI